MIKRRLLFLVIFVPIMVSGCFLRPTCCKNKFIVNKLPAPKSTIKTNGIYVSTNSKGSFFLFDGGKFHNHSTLFPSGSEFWNNPQKGMENIYDDWFFDRKEGWGDFSIKEDSITIQFFTSHPQEFCKRWIYEMKGNIINDSTIEIHSVYYNLIGGSYLSNYTNIFSFYPCEKKPQIDHAWLYKKRWYKKGLHESRKQR